MKTKSICVFASSSDDVSQSFRAVAGELGSAIASRGFSLVYGASNVGLMGEMARAAHKAGGKVVGIIPKILHHKVPVLAADHELIVTEDMRHRKTLMELRSDAFIALPGGFGTLEELLEILTLKQLGYHSKPIVVLNSESFYSPLIQFFDEMIEKKFARSKSRGLFQVSGSVPEAFAFLDEQFSGGAQDA